MGKAVADAGIEHRAAAAWITGVLIWAGAILPGVRTADVEEN
jgi:hypothetical protein